MSTVLRCVSTQSPPPPQFEHITLSKRELLSNVIAVHVATLAEIETVLPELTRMRGVIIVDADHNDQHCLAAGLLLLYRHHDEWPSLARQVIPVLHLVSNALHNENREHEQELMLQRLRYDLDTMQEDYQRVTSRLQQQVSLMHAQAGELRTMNEVLEQRVQARTADLTSAYQELESFSYSISHDLRAPIRAVIGFGEMLRETAYTKMDDEEQHQLSRIIQTAIRMNDLVDSLLALAKTARSEIRKQAVDISSLSLEVFNDLMINQEPRQLEFVVQPGMFVYGDRQLLTAVLNNVIANSIKFTSHRTQARIAIALRRDTNTDTILVIDNGAGFDKTLANRLFTPFFRMHRQEEFPGTGVGLATVQRIMQRHGGSVSIESAVDQGTEVALSLPNK